MIRGQPALEHLPGLTVQPARHHRSCVHIQPNTSFRCGYDYHHYDRLLTVNFVGFLSTVDSAPSAGHTMVTLLTVDSGSYTALERISS